MPRIANTNDKTSFLHPSACLKPLELVADAVGVDAFEMEVGTEFVEAVGLGLTGSIVCLLAGGGGVYGSPPVIVISEVMKIAVFSTLNGATPV